MILKTNAHKKGMPIVAKIYTTTHANTRDHESRDTIRTYQTDTHIKRRTTN